MNYCNNSFCLWLSKHIVTTLIIISVILFTLLYYYLNQYTRELFDQFSFFICSDFSYLGWFIIWQILLSGLEVTVGSLKYSLWIFFNAFLIIISRIFLLTETYGCAYILYTQFISFLLIHKPYLYFKIKKLQFTDTHFYFIGMIQTLYLCRSFLDIPTVMIGNILFKLLLKVFSCCQRPRTSILHDTEGIGAEINNEEESD